MEVALNKSKRKAINHCLNFKYENPVATSASKVKI